MSVIDIPTVIVEITTVRSLATMTVNNMEVVLKITLVEEVPQAATENSAHLIKKDNMVKNHPSFKIVDQHQITGIESTGDPDLDLKVVTMSPAKIEEETEQVQGAAVTVKTEPSTMITERIPEMRIEVVSHILLQHTRTTTRRFKTNTRAKIVTTQKSGEARVEEQS